MTKRDWRQLTIGVLRQDGTGYLGVLERTPAGFGRQVRVILCAEVGCLSPATVVATDGRHRCASHVQGRA